MENKLAEANTGDGYGGDIIFKTAPVGGSGMKNANGNYRFVSDDEGTDEEIIDVVCNKDENDNYNGEFTFEKAWNKIISLVREITNFQIIDKAQIFALHHIIQELSRQLDAEKTFKSLLKQRCLLETDLTAKKAKTAKLETYMYLT